jgi:hypothetical protein
VTPDTDLATLFEHIGASVKVGGLIRELNPDGFLLDDGTAVARVALTGDAAALLPDLRAGEPVAVKGIVRQQDEALLIEVSSGGDVARVGDLGQGLPLTSGPATSTAASAATGPAALAVGDGGLLPQELSVATLAALTAASLLVTLIRKRTAARRSRAVVLARVAALGRPRDPLAPHEHAA